MHMRYHSMVALIRHDMPKDGIICLDNGLYKGSNGWWAKGGHKVGVRV